MSEKRHYLKETKSGETIHKGFINNKTSSNTREFPDVISPIYQKVFGCQLVPQKSNGMSSPELSMLDAPSALGELLRADRALNNKPIALPRTMSMTLPESMSMILPTCVSMTLPESHSKNLPVSDSKTLLESMSMIHPTSVPMNLSTSHSTMFLTSESMTLPISVSMSLPTSLSMALPKSMSMILPTSVSMSESVTHPISVSNENTMNEHPKANTRLVSLLHSGLDDHHTYLAKERITCSKARLTATFQQKQKQCDIFGPNNRGFSERLTDSMSEPHTKSSVSPSPNSRLSEGDQTVPHSVSPVRESPTFDIGDEYSACVLATTVPPPEVLTLTGAESVETLNEGRMNQLNASENGIQSLDNYEYFIHKVDQNSLEAQSKEKCPITNGGIVTGFEGNTTSDICKDISVLDTENAPKASDCQMDDNPPKEHIQIQTDSDDECCIIDNNVSESIGRINHNVSINIYPDSNEPIDNHCITNDKDETPMVITLDDDGDGKLDEELSEMRRYYLEDDKEQDSNKLSETSPTDLRKDCPDLHSVSQESDLRWKQMSEKRYFLQDSSRETGVEPGEIIHNISTDSDTVASNEACFNDSSGTYIPTHSEYGSQIRNSVREHLETIPETNQAAAISKTANHVRSTNLHLSFERQFDSGNYSQLLQNAEACYVSNVQGLKCVGNSQTKSRCYNSVLFPVSIKSGGLHETEILNRSKEKVHLKRKLHEDINQNYVNPSCVSSAVLCDSFQGQCTNHKQFHTENITDLTYEKDTHTTQSYFKTPKLDVTVQSYKNKRPSKKTTSHLNGIIEKLWVSKTCLKDQMSNALSSSMEVSKSIHEESSDNMSSVFTNMNSKKSRKNSVKMFECSTCGFQDKRYSGIEKHVVEKHRPDGCTCDSCGQTLVNHCQCQGRFKISSKVATFECSICRKQCRTRHGLRQHETKKHGHYVTSCLSAYQPPYTCTMCGEDQHGYSRFKEHMLTHGVARPFTCKVCRKSFHSKSGLALHFSKVHQLPGSLN